MFVVVLTTRHATSLTTRGSVNLRSIVSTACTRKNNNTNTINLNTVIRRTMGAQAGTVKFYLRDKGYGFIQPDQNPDTDVFVHRNNISCTHRIPPEVYEYTQRYPYLKKDERVLFELDYENATGLRKAYNVTWLNGSKIPPERTNFLGGVHERAKGILGTELFKLLLKHQEDPMTLDDQTLLKNIKDHFRQAQISIQSGEEIIRRLGMNVNDFPIIKSLTGRGKYVFEEESTNKQYDVSVSTDELLDNLELPPAKLQDYSKVELDDIPDLDTLPDDKPSRRVAEEDHEYIIESDDEEKDKKQDDTVWKI